MKIRNDESQNNLLADKENGIEGQIKDQINQPQSFIPKPNQSKTLTLLNFMKDERVVKTAEV